MNNICNEIAIRNIVMNAPTGNIKSHCQIVLNSQLKACPISTGKGIIGRIDKITGTKITVSKIEIPSLVAGLSSIAIVF